jgi:single-strand DNA-binding protein
MLSADLLKNCDLRKEVRINMQKNRIEVAGYVSAKPTLRHLPSGTPIANVRLGESHTYTDADAKSHKHTNWHSLSFYGDLSRIAMTFEKGDNLFAEGTIEQRQFTPKNDGVQRTVNEIVVRTCHLIATPRASEKAAATNGVPIPNDSSIPEAAQSGAEHYGWPIG